MCIGEVAVRFSIVIATSLVIVAQRFSYSWVAHSTTGVVFGWISVVSLALILDTVAPFPIPLGPLNVFRVLPENASDDTILGYILTFSALNANLLICACGRYPPRSDQPEWALSSG